MTRDEMVKLAIEAGWQYADGDDGYSPLWRFGALVAERVAAAEREACAKVCEEAYPYSVMHTDQRASKNCAAAIRARGEK